MIPVYIKVPCGMLRSPCQFEVVMQELDAMQVLISTVHKFPKEEEE